MKNGSPIFYKLLEQMGEIHNRKSHDYASNNDPFANYKFAGMLSKLFSNPDDAGFIGRIGEKLYRLANLENSNKNPSNESIEDTEVDICVIIALWVAMRRERRGYLTKIKQEQEQIAYHHAMSNDPVRSMSGGLKFDQAGYAEEPSYPDKYPE